METTFQKYRDIKARYDSFVKKNKQSLIYENGAYLKKTLYEREKQEKNDKWIDPLQSESKFLLQEGDKEIFVKDEGQSETIYTYQKDRLIEKATVEKKNNTVYLIDNLAEGTAVRYDFNKNKVYLSQYIQDEQDPGKRDIMLDQEFINNELVLERNYKKDFKVSKEQMLSALPDNFYNSALDYMMRKYKDEYEKYIEEEYKRKASPNEIEKIIKDRVQELKEKLKTTIETKNDFYKKIEIYKTYNENSYPLYDLSFPDSHVGIWEMKIDGKTNEVIDIRLSIPRD
ncbi:hypothetical protein [Chryseobacterium sp. FH2]|uniref:hypothetical protein n=1 Tax=Chryseobacterium sp. FH2 TaxID=1674291 RepID=UPI00103B08EF|nr:hypothetical protein [Chryseobacterium sp. FH2]